MKMIITKDTAVNMENITALEVDVKYSEYKLETGEIEKVKNPVGHLWAKTTGSAVILKTIWERTAEGITMTEEKMTKELTDLMLEIVEKSQTQNIITIK